MGSAPRHSIGRDRSAEILEQGHGILVGDRQHRNLHQRVGFAERQSLGAGHRGEAGRERIAGILRDVEDAAALRAA